MNYQSFPSINQPYDHTSLYGYHNYKLCRGFKYFFHPYLGKIPMLTNIVQMGWNHQLVNMYMNISIWQVCKMTSAMYKNCIHHHNPSTPITSTVVVKFWWPPSQIALLREQDVTAGGVWQRLPSAFPRFYWNSTSLTTSGSQWFPTQNDTHPPTEMSFMSHELGGFGNGPSHRHNGTIS